MFCTKSGVGHGHWRLIVDGRHCRIRSGFCGDFTTKRYVWRTGSARNMKYSITHVGQKKTFMFNHSGCPSSHPEGWKGLFLPSEVLQMLLSPHVVSAIHDAIIKIDAILSNVVLLPAPPLTMMSTDPPPMNQRALQEQLVQSEYHDGYNNDFGCRGLIS